LGTGESGKSTIVKQMKLLHNVDDRESVGFSETERKDATVAARTNLMDAVVTLMEAHEELVTEGLEEDLEDLGDEALQAKDIVLRYLCSLPPPGYCGKEPLPVEVGSAVAVIWSDAAVRRLHDDPRLRRRIQLADSAAHFLDIAEKVADESYEPDDRDVLRTRTATTGIVKIEFEMRSRTFRMFDVRKTFSMTRSFLSFRPTGWRATERAQEVDPL